MKINKNNKLNINNLAVAGWYVQYYVYATKLTRPPVPDKGDKYVFTIMEIVYCFVCILPVVGGVKKTWFGKI